jgi:predicted nucleotidyltransferase
MVASQNQIRRIVTKFVRALEPEVKVERVILYGSYAVNLAREGSDIDLAVISPDFAAMSEIKQTDFLARKLIHCDSRLMPLVYTPTQFDEVLPHLFPAEIKRTGKVIYDVRPKKRRRLTLKLKQNKAR